MEGESSDQEDREQLIAGARGSESRPAPFKQQILPMPTTDKERRARLQIDADVYNAEAWAALAAEAQARPAVDAAPLFEYLLSTFPTAARYWKIYAEAQMGQNNHEAVKAIFSRCLLCCRHVDLWRSYLKYIRHTNDSRGLEGREEVKKAYDFTVEQVGMDIGAGPIWQDYIAFLKSAPATTPAEESQRILAVRKVYQRAVLVPMHGMEQLWRDYEQYENGLNRALAKGLLSELQPKYVNARAVYRERKKLTEPLNLNILPLPPSKNVQDGSPFSAWKKLLAFERSNPQRLDPALLAARVTFTFEQCLMVLPQFPEVWYAYATWQAERGAAEAAVAVFERALKALPGSALLRFALVEFEEARGNVKEARAVYEAMLENAAIANALVYIQLMRFVRRVEDREAARKVFMAARKSPLCTYHVFVAAALLEFYVDKDPKVARNIFELGLKRHISEPAYVLQYLDFLKQLNDERNMRALFERALSVLPPDKAVEVWNRFVEFEAVFGDLQSVMKVAARRREALKDTNAALADEGLQAIVERYRYLDLLPCSSADYLKGQGARQGAAAAGSAPTLETTGAPPVLSSSRVGATLPPSRPPATPGNLQPPLPPGPPPPSAQANAATTTSLAPRPPQPHPPAPPSSTGIDNPLIKQHAPILAYFLSVLPPVQGPYPDIDVVIGVLAHAELPPPVNMPPAPQITPSPTLYVGMKPFPVPPVSSPSQLAPRPTVQASMAGKRKETESGREEDISLPVVQNKPPPRDIFRLRQMQRAKGASGSSLSSAGPNESG